MMGKPDDISQEAWDAAETAFDLALCNCIESSGSAAQLRIDSITPLARAIIAAKDEERKAILQFEFDLPVHLTGADMMVAIREYIQKRGEA